ncbi:HU family DNA-binding protein [Methyloglobulus sp.]|uniref:HU family DNA-binding protein n=1 Tax=Methyloglobulus sp. TaxID=2518622 RepID=UPI0032B78182
MSTTYFMNKAEFISALAKKQPHLKRKGVEAAVGIILAQMEQTLNAKERIEIRGFGAFSARHLPARTRRNPMTGDEIHSPSRYAFHFKPSRALKLKVDKAKDAIQLSD